MENIKKQKKSKRITKGNYGYIKYEKKRRVLMTLLMFAIPISIYISGWIYHGTNMNILTVVAICGCLPACKATVGVIMIMMQKSLSKEDYELFLKAHGDLICGYELVLTAYEHTAPFQAVAVCGNQLICYTPLQKTDISFFEKHIRQIMKENNVSNIQIKIFKDSKQYIQRASVLCKNQEQYRENINWTPDERYPDLSRDEFIYYTLLAISL